MRGQCCICTELFQADSDISATQCGHTFHSICLRQWTKQSKTCPHCRKKINERYVVEKLYFDEAAESDDGDDDICILKNQIANLKANISEKKKEKKELQQENNTLEKKIIELTERYKAMEKLYKEGKSTIATLKKELRYHEELEKDAIIAREEANLLRRKLADLKNVELLVNGNEEEIQKIMSNGDIKQLSTWCCVLQKELRCKRQECKSLRETVEKLKKDLNATKHQTVERIGALKVAEKQVELLKGQLQDSNNEVNNMKRKLTALEKALESPTDTIRSFAHRLIHESPAPLLSPPKKKLRLIDQNTSLMSPDLFASPTSTITAEKAEHDDKKTEKEDLGTKYMKITSAAQNGSKKKLDSEVSVSNIHGIGSYNLFKKRSGMGVADSASAIRKGYNGLGGHDKFVNPKGFTTVKAPTAKKMKSVFGPQRTTHTKGTASIENFIYLE